MFSVSLILVLLAFGLTLVNGITGKCPFMGRRASVVLGASHRAMSPALYATLAALDALVRKWQGPCRGQGKASFAALERLGTSPSG